MVTVSMEEIECGAFLQDAGICFADDNALEASLIKGIEITKPLIQEEMSNSFVPVSPEHTSEFSESSLEPLHLLSGADGGGGSMLQDTIPVVVSPFMPGSEIKRPLQVPPRTAVLVLNNNFTSKAKSGNKIAVSTTKNRKRKVVPDYDFDDDHSGEFEGKDNRR